MSKSDRVKTPMTNKDLPSQVDLLNTFEYVEGVLYWKSHPRFKKSYEGRVAGGLNVSVGRLYVSLNSERYLVHRVIYKMVNGYCPSYVDHINGNCLDNRIENLRECSASQNQQNMSIPKANKTGMKGVSIVDNGKIRATIGVNGKRIRIGNFPTIDEAAHAYNKAAIHYFGEFAKLNPIGKDKIREGI